MLLGYVRVSSQDQTKGTSPAEQERVIKAMTVARGLGEFDVAIYRDNGVSGSVPLHKRPAGARMLEAAQPGDTIVAAKLDRAFRDARDALEVFEHCRQKGIDLIVYDLGHESVTRDGVSKMIFTILGAVAEMERGRIADRVQSGKRAKAARGGHTGGFAPYGFRVEGEGKEARLEVDQNEQELVALIRRVHREAPTLADAHRRLIDMKVCNRTGTWFTKTQITRIATRAVHTA